jgi:hypothetical protein
LKNTIGSCRQYVFSLYFQDSEYSADNTQSTMRPVGRSLKYSAKNAAPGRELSEGKRKVRLEAASLSPTREYNTVLAGSKSRMLDGS